VYAGKDRLDVARAENIISGFKAYQTLTALQSGNANKVQQPSVDLTAKEVLTLMFAPNGSYLQDLLLTEVYSKEVNSILTLLIVRKFHLMVYRSNSSYIVFFT
jgi:hypothetical protein